MKKVLALSVFAVLGLAALSSCKKDYTCDCGGGSETTSTGLTKAQAATLETSCKAAGCDWSAK